MQQTVTLTYENALNRANELAAQEQWTDTDVTELKRLVAGLEKARSAGRQTEVADFHRISAGGQRPTGPTFVEPSGAKIQAYRFGERLTQQAAVEPGEVGEAVRCMLLGRDVPKGVVRNVAGSDASNLSYSIPSYLSSSLIDLARSKSVCLQAGANTVPLQGGNLTMMTVTGDPVMQWRGGVANAWNTFQVSQPTFDRVQLSLKDVGCLTAISLSLLEDSSNAAQMLEQIMSAVMAQAVDKAILAGAGTLEPVGILNAASGVTAIANVGAISSYADHVSAVRKVLDANYQGDMTGLSWLSSPTIRAAFQSLVSSSTDALIEAPDWIKSLKSYTTTALNLPTSPVEYADVIGDMSTVVVGVRPSGVLVDMVNTGVGVDGSNNVYDATGAIGYLLRIFFRMDVALTRPTWLVKLTGITG